MIELGIDELNGCPSTDSTYENMESLSKQAKRDMVIDFHADFLVARSPLNMMGKDVETMRNHMMALS